MGRGRKILIGVAVVIVAATAFPYVRGDLETRTLDDAARAGLPDLTFVKLSDGYTRYEWGGPEDGEVVVLVHGFSSPCDIWEYQFEALTKAGYHTLRYDLFGRGYSDRPAGAYDADRYDRQLLDLLDSQDLKDPVNLVGLSMGGAIVTRFTDRHPERVKRMALIAPAGLGADLPAIAQVARVPGLRDWIMKAFGDGILLGRAGEMFTKDPEKAAIVVDMYREQMSYKGYKRALISTLLNTELRALHDLYARVGEQDRPKALFWGTADGVVPFRYSEEMRELLPGVRFVEVESARHGMNYEQPEDINVELLAFLKEEASAG